jgi:hypothetical protein
VETANEGRFSSRICSERVDGVDYELNSLKKIRVYRYLSQGRRPY